MNMRSPLWFVFAGVIAVASLVGAWLFVTPRIAAFGASLTRAVMPGPATLTLDKAGRYTIYAEIGGTIDGRLYDRLPPNGTQVSLVSEATGKPVTLAAPQATAEYSLGPRKGQAAIVFAIDQPGQYRLASTGETGAGSGYVLVVAYGSTMGSIGTLLGPMFIATAIGMAGLAIAGIIVALTVTQRAKAKSLKSV